MKDNGTVLDYFELYLTDTIVGHIVTETNRYAGQFLAANPEKATNTYWKYWEPVTINEMKKIIGILLLMGIIYKATLHMYWSTDELYPTPVFNELMMRDRFDLLMKLHKICPFLEMMRHQFRTVYTPGRELCVDESLVLFKGRLHFRQFIRTKRARFGIKLYEFTTSEGIILDLLIYSGKGMFNFDEPYTPMTEDSTCFVYRQFLYKSSLNKVFI